MKEKILGILDPSFMKNRIMASNKAALDPDLTQNIRMGSPALQAI